MSEDIDYEHAHGVVCCELAELQAKVRGLEAELAAEREVSADFAEQLKLRSESQMAADLQEALNAHNETIAERDTLRAELAAERKTVAASCTDIGRAMSDITERLREIRDRDCYDAAAEIERLRAELSKADQIITAYDAASVEIGADLHANITRANDAEAERDTLRAELAAAEAKVATTIDGAMAVARERDTLRAELAAEERRIAVMAKEIAELRARSDALRADKAEAERDALRAALVKAGEALEIVVASYGPWIKGTKQQIALAEIRKLTERMMNVDEALEKAFDAYDKHAPWRGQQSADFLASLRANGFVVVPVKATEKMMRSACEIDCGLEVCDDAGKCAHDTRWQLYAETWRYMIAAAQENDDGHD